VTAPAGPTLPCGHPFAALTAHPLGIVECSACRAAVGKADRLDGWKDIAAALGVDRATAMTWHNREVDPLPVRRDRKGVYASRAALERWLHGGDMPLAVHDELRRLRAGMAELEQVVAEIAQVKAQLASLARSAPRRGAARDAAKQLSLF